MPDHEPVGADVPFSELPAEEKAKRAGSFGEVAAVYERYRPGPPMAALDWMLPSSVGTVVDLGAGTGAMSRLLTGRAREVIAVEPDDRMRSILGEEVPGIRVVDGRGEAMPLPDSSVDAVLASASWHWMEPVQALREVGRILVPGGILGAVWSGPDPEGPFLAQAQTLLAEQSAGSEVGNLIIGDAQRPTSTLEIPDGVPFEQPEHEVFTWDIALNADELIGLLRTLSSIITLPDERRESVVAEARRLLRELLGVEGDVTVEVAFRADAWRSRRHN